MMLLLPRRSRPDEERIPCPRRSGGPGQQSPRHHLPAASPLRPAGAGGGGRRGARRSAGRFRWRRVLYRIARAEGPERIAAEWWRDDELTRDYFRVEDAEGHRFWLFREGLYGRETTAPRWYLHGVFA